MMKIFSWHFLFVFVINTHVSIAIVTYDALI